MPKRKGEHWTYHSNRTVIHPDYAGLGLGIKLIDESSRLMREEHRRARIMACFSSIPVYKAMVKSPVWRLLKANRVLGDRARTTGRKMQRGKGSFRDRGVVSFSFEYIG